MNLHMSGKGFEKPLVILSGDRESFQNDPSR